MIVSAVVEGVVVVAIQAAGEVGLSTDTVKPGKCASSYLYASSDSSFYSDSDKKIHQSWGGDDGNTELKTEEAATFDAAAETNNEWGSATVNNDWGGSAETNADGWVSAPDASASAPAEGEPKPEGARGRKDKEAEEEDNTLTLDQYLAQKKEKESVVPKLEGIRKANEGTNEDWKGIVPLAKNEDEESYYVGKVLRCIPFFT